MNKIGIAILALSAAIGAAQPTVNATPAASAKPKHFRLTFLLTYPDGQPSQTYALDVPVSPDKPGASSLALSTGPAGQEEGRIEETLQCADVHESETGLAAQVSFSMHSISPEKMPGTNEAIHSRITFEHQVNLVLGQPRRITEPLQRKPLGKGDGQLQATPAAPQITLTVTAI